MLAVLQKSDILRLAQIVREETGNQVEEKNYSMLESRLRTRMLKLRIGTMQEYWDFFEANEDEERTQLQSLMTTHYTFFFREYVHFEVIDERIQKEHIRLKDRYEKTKRPVKVWSAACSRGHEVYSLALYLEHNLHNKYGVPFEVLGTDIDIESVDYAKNGVYPLKEVNTIPKMYLNSHWKRGTGPIKEFAAVHPNMKAKTKFHVMNLLEVDKFSAIDKYDLVLCRNVFIYFSEENIKKIATGLVKNVEPGGLFISGISEPIRFPDWKYETLGPTAYVVPSVQAPAILKPTVAKTQAPASAKPAQEPETYRVLCVDDSSTIQTLLKKIFSQDPLCKHIDFASNGREAREKLNKNKYDLITLDIHMPEVNGIEFLEKLYNKNVDPTVLMVSSVNRADLTLANKALSLGAFDYIEKPEMNNLQKSIDEILTKAKMAMRSRSKIELKQIGQFDQSIGKEIIVPDASMCLRIIVASPKKMRQLEQIVRSQEPEVRSPATLIVWSDSSQRDLKNFTSLQTPLQTWTKRPLLILNESNKAMRPNQTYMIKAEAFADFARSLNFKSYSVQVLEFQGIDFSGYTKMQSRQVLLDESLVFDRKVFEAQTGIKVNDISPATSFTSLSVEFFAHVRKIAA